ncbi:MAG: hypothetical protein R2942_01870 [Ignavibacteria bacterium]
MVNWLIGFENDVILNFTKCNNNILLIASRQIENIRITQKGLKEQTYNDEVVVV